MEAINNQRRRGPDVLFYVFAALTLLVRRARHRQSVQPQSGHERDVSGADHHFDGRAVRAAARVLPGRGADPRLCRRGHGAVPVRHHAAGFEGGTTAQNQNFSASSPVWFPSGIGDAFFEIAGASTIQRSRAAAARSAAALPFRRRSHHALGKFCSAKNTRCRLKSSRCCCSWR
jgi:hypothetical protein